MSSLFPLLSSRGSCRAKRGQKFVAEYLPNSFCVPRMGTISGIILARFVATVSARFARQFSRSSPGKISRYSSLARHTRRDARRSSISGRDLQMNHYRSSHQMRRSRTYMKPLVRHTINGNFSTMCRRDCIRASPLIIPPCYYHLHDASRNPKYN